jgi:hypothetical protein
MVPENWMGKRPSEDTFTSAEVRRRTEAALRAAFNSPHKTYEESKVGKKRSPAPAKPRSRSRKKRDDRS